MKMTALEVIFWFPLKSFSSLKGILQSVFSAFLLCFKANRKDCIANVQIFFFWEAISCNAKKGYTLSTSGLRSERTCLQLKKLLELLWHWLTSFFSPFMIWICAFLEMWLSKFYFYFAHVVSDWWNVHE